MSFPPVLSRRFATESLSVNAINIAPLRAAKLRSYWKRSVFHDYFHNFIAQLRAARKSLLESQLKEDKKKTAWTKEDKKKMAWTKEDKKKMAWTKQDKKKITT
jgi:hypothetical protein